jgi:hypothetical protein
MPPDVFVSHRGASVWRSASPRRNLSAQAQTRGVATRRGKRGASELLDDLSLGDHRRSSRVVFLAMGPAIPHLAISPLVRRACCKPLGRRKRKGSTAGAAAAPRRLPTNRRNLFGLAYGGACQE